MKIPYQIFRLLLLACSIASAKAQIAHHFTAIAFGSNATATVQVDGSVSNLFSLTASMRSQYVQMFDIYPIDASQDLTHWTRHATFLRLISDPAPLSWQDANIGP